MAYIRNMVWTSKRDLKRLTRMNLSEVILVTDDVESFLDFAIDSVVLKKYDSK